MSVNPEIQARTFLHPNIRTEPLYRDEAWMAENRERLDTFFPAVDPGVLPSGSLLLVQLRTPRTKSKGGLFLVQESQDIEKWNQQTGRVIHMAPMAFRNRNDGSMWPEGDWCQPGDFIRVKKWGGDRWEQKIPGREGETALFVIVNDLDVVGHITGDPFDITNFNLNL